jgi:hypothetical protein
MQTDILVTVFGALIAIVCSWIFLGSSNVPNNSGRDSSEVETRSGRAKQERSSIEI